MWAAAPALPGHQLPEFPWDRLDPYAATARAHPDGLVDLSIGTPVDPTPAAVQEALRAAADAPGYPPTAGTPALRAAAVDWLARSLGVVADPAAVLPTIGSKELVALLPWLLGLGPGDEVCIPALAYPTYEVGALLAGARVVTEPTRLTRLRWLNSPANPHGRVLSVGELRAAVEDARAHGTLLACDECYIELGWTAEPVSLLHPDVCGGSHAGLLAVHSLSKRSNLAGYRAGFVVGDPAIVATLLGVRKHAGFMPPAPVQAAAAAALMDDEHAAAQKARYARRRDVLIPALRDAGFSVDDSAAGLYLWVSRGEGCWASVAALASVGVLVAPGEFYGEAGRRHVRVALTATDEAVGAVAGRLSALPPPAA